MFWKIYQKILSVQIEMTHPTLCLFVMRFLYHEDFTQICYDNRKNHIPPHPTTLATGWLAGMLRMACAIDRPTVKPPLLSWLSSYWFLT